MNIIDSIDGLPMGAIVPDSIVNADCLEAMKLLPDNSIDLILSDPPYFKVKKEQWDNQWDTSDGFLKWLDLVAEQWHRILKPNGSLYCFASPRMAARVEVKLGDRFNVLSNIRWIKEAGWHQKARKEDSRQYQNPWESIVFCEHHGADNIAKGEAGYGAKCDELRGFIFEPLRAYLDGEKTRARLSNKQVNEALGTATNGSGMAGHYFKPSGSIQWDLPTEHYYTKLQQAFSEYFTRPYEDLRLEYEDLRLEYENLRRPFSVTAEVPYTDVWTYPTVSHYPGKHPCEKNLKMLEHIITASSREGAIVLDSFSGSASTAIACINTNRRYILIEKDPDYFQTSCDRVSNHSPNAPIAKIRKPKAAPKGQLALF